jgi:sec-independent protein translocase protein TatA
MARTLGKAMREFKKATANVEEQFKQAMEEPPPPPPPRRVPSPPAPQPVTTPALVETRPNPVDPESPKDQTPS